ncbi:MAG: ABC transporter ATP-binding protein [Telmatospirillum sp.]|nr:ABC transporter ATP-binding protein [Telmatospirillum sp.]
MSILEARRLRVRLGRRDVLTDVSVGITPGEVLGLLGPNGAGKTTLLKALAGLLPAEGCFLDDRPVGEVPARERARRMAYLPQTPGSHWPMSVRDVVSLGRLPHHRDARRERDRAAIDRAIAEADIGSLVSRPMNELSGGERARVLLARALAVGAPVLLADEPAAFLDAAHQLRVLQLLRRRADRGDAVVVVLHDLSAALRFCDRVAVLGGGRLVALGTPAAVLSDDVLARIFGIRVARGEREGTPFFQPWLPVAS